MEILRGNSSLNIVGGTITGKTNGIWINGNSGATVTLGTNGNGINISEPIIIATDGGGIHVESGGVLNFYDGKVIGPTGSSITGTGTVNYPSGYTKKVTDRGDGKEAATLGWETTASDTLVVDDSTEYHGQRSGSQGEVWIKQWPIYPPPFSAGDVYQLEVDVKGTGRMWNYFYGENGYLKVSNLEVIDGRTSSNGDGANIAYLSSEYTHYEVRFTLGSTGDGSVVKFLLFRLDYVAGESDDAYIKNVKFYKINSTSGTNSVNNVNQLSTSSPKSLSSLRTSMLSTSLNINNVEENNNQVEQQASEQEKTTANKPIEISGNTYSTISQAIQTANSGETIKLLEDISLEESIIIPKDKTITIDLNGKTLTSNDTSTITNNGELTITSNVDSDVKPEEKGTLTNECEKGTVIINNGELVVDKIQIIVSKEDSVGINNVEGTVTLGVDESKETDENGNTKEIEVNTEIPVIYATGENTTALINSKKGIIYFYDGRIVSTSTIKNIITSVLENYEINEEFNSNNISSTLRLIMNKKEGSDK